jgi:hypothetical protein
MEPMQAQAQMPTPGGLMKRVLAALAAAGVILTAFVLPAEYGIDPIGIGKAFGLTQMAKNTAAAEPEGIPKLPLAPPDQTHFYDKPWHTDEIKIKLKGDGELEYKFRMKAGEAIVYSWTADKMVYYDFHAEPEPPPGVAKESFKAEAIRYKEVQETTEAHGALTAPFDGIHGWYWLNLDGKPATITLKVSGFYTLRPKDEQPTETEPGSPF